MSQRVHPFLFIIILCFSVHLSYLSCLPSSPPLSFTSYLFLLLHLFFLLPILLILPFFFFFSIYSSSTSLVPVLLFPPSLHFPLLHLILLPPPLPHPPSPPPSATSACSFPLPLLFFLFFLLHLIIQTVLLWVMIPPSHENVYRHFRIPVALSLNLRIPPLIINILVPEKAVFLHFLFTDTAGLDRFLSTVTLWWIWVTTFLINSLCNYILTSLILTLKMEVACSSKTIVTNYKMVSHLPT
jgi:hypothetical protein